MPLKHFRYYFLILITITWSRLRQQISKGSDFSSSRLCWPQTSSAILMFFRNLLERYCTYTALFQNVTGGGGIFVNFMFQAVLYFHFYRVHKGVMFKEVEKVSDPGNLVL